MVTSSYSIVTSSYSTTSAQRRPILISIGWCQIHWLLPGIQPLFFNLCATEGGREGERERGRASERESKSARESGGGTERESERASEKESQRERERESESERDRWEKEGLAGEHMYECVHACVYTRTHTDTRTLSLFHKIRADSNTETDQPPRKPKS